MKAARLHEYDESIPSDSLTVEEIEEPKIEGPLDVIVRIGAAGLCRANIDIVEGQWAPIQDPDHTPELGSLPSGRGTDDEGGLRDLPGADARACPASRAVVVLDNLSSHEGGKVKEIVEGAGCELVYLPPYPADYNPIVEQAFSKIKGLLRKTEARTREALIEAMGRALAAVTVGDVRAFFTHCGYQPMDQLL